MRIKIYITLISLLFTLSNYAQDSITQIKIQWTNLDSVSIEFTKNWNYPEGIYLNQWGQVSCDGYCPEAMDGLKDKQGKIKDENLDLAYAIIDTTHQHHTIQCTAIAYEFGDTHYISNEGYGDLIQLNTRVDAGTHSQLVINQIYPEEFITAHIYFNSIVSDTSPTTFQLKEGWIIIDPKLYALGIFKSQFEFTFHNHLEKDDLKWSGVIYIDIN